ncbi:Interface between microtubules and kinetochore protein [Orobanche gracilis]
MAYADIGFIYTGRMPEAAGVFAFGVILCELLYKRKVDERLRVDHKLKMNHKLKIQCKRQKEYSFVDKSFEEDSSFNALDGPKISKLARFCVDENPVIRPNIQAVLKWLEELHAVRDHDMMHKPYQVV